MNRYSMVFLFSFVIQGSFAQKNETRSIVADPVYSTILFSVPISSGLTRVTGKFNEFSVRIELVDDDILKSKIKAIIKVNSINTGNTARDNALLTPLFFDAQKYPEITFVSDTIMKAGNGYLVSGQFQMHGITRPIDLPFSITGKRGEDVIGFRCRYPLLRSAYNLGVEYKHATDDNFIDNEIGIEIDFWTKRPPRLIR